MNVGKLSAMAMVADFAGGRLVAPFLFSLDRLGIGELITRAPAQRSPPCEPAGIIACALANRANRIAFAMVRDQAAYDPGRWRT